MQFLDVAVLVCKSEHPDFKKAKDRTWNNASLMGQCKCEGKDFKKTCDRVSLRQETLKNRKEDFRNKLLKNCKGIRP
jgi:hypothetical protein